MEHYLTTIYNGILTDEQMGKIITLLQESENTVFLPYGIPTVIMTNASPEFACQLIDKVKTEALESISLEDCSSVVASNGEDLLSKWTLK